MTIPKKYDISTEHGLDECGYSETLYVEFTCYWELEPEEPMVMYDNDGSGYPGSPAHANLLDVNVTLAENDGGSFSDLKFLAGLEDEIRRKVDRHIDQYMFDAMEAANERDQGLMDDAYESKMEQMWEDRNG